MKQSIRGGNDHRLHELPDAGEGLQGGLLGHCDAPPQEGQRLLRQTKQEFAHPCSSLLKLSLRNDNTRFASPDALNRPAVERGQFARIAIPSLLKAYSLRITGVFRQRLAAIVAF